MMVSAFDWGASLTNDLPDRLRLSTRDLHTAAERTPLMAALLAGRIERATYCALLRNLHAIYEALESAGPAPVAGAVDLPGPLSVFDMVALRRTDTLAADLDRLHGLGWHEALVLQPAAQAYAERLRHLAAVGSCALIAHAYVRYLGDLHGGQLLKRRVTQALDLAGDAGVSFYEFGSVEQVLGLRQALRETLGNLPLAATDIALVVDEARWAFRQHLRLFEELQVEKAAG